MTDPLAKSVSRTTNRTLLVAGPHSPRVGGGVATVKVLLDELARQSIRTALVSTSHPPNYRRKKRLLHLETIRRVILIIRLYIGKIRSSNVVLVFANDLFAFTLVPLLLLVARWHRKPFYLKPVGGSLDLYIAAQRKPIQIIMASVLRAADGILAQTWQLQAGLTQLGCTNVHYVPGCRPLPRFPLLPRTYSEELRLIFMSHIRQEKGPLILLEALCVLAQENNAKVTCDFYGPIFEEDRKEFFHRLEGTRGVRYCGMAKMETASRLIAAYDALVLPTWFMGEGHPGVIIESMHAGVPVISTEHRSIPELIAHGVNGLLVPVRDSQALADAIRRIALDRSLKEQMGKANHHRGQKFRADVVVPQMLEIMFPE